jgi:hypothetical protein
VLKAVRSMLVFCVGEVRSETARMLLLERAQIVVACRL